MQSSKPLEFRYAVLNEVECEVSAELYGNVIKFIEHCFYSNIRVVKSEEHRRLAAAEFNFSTAMSRDGANLDC
ncbi:hypothetical protein F2P58_12850 [Vibrio fortis]|uniref:Uncharacterized protein n=1 Tax=Vibrio fortis TaxID=212667 RepID=A0A5N3R1H3_9VIBR|nr:hypothetical protein [Vibrio fortis]KAB0288327.1 hypothetical protein F2P58_12850 [Vibrio fortis]